MLVHVEPAPVTVTVPCEPGKLPTAPKIGHRPTALDRERARPVLAYGKILRCPTRARDHCRLWQHGVNVGIRCGRRDAGTPVTGVKPIGGGRPCPIRLGARGE